MSNFQESIELEATAKKRLQIADANLKSDKLTTTQPWRKYLPAGVEMVHLDESIETDMILHWTMKHSVMLSLQKERLEEYLDDYGLHMDGTKYYNSKNEEVKLPKYVQQSFDGIETLLSMCFAKLASPSAEKASAAMHGMVPEPQKQQSVDGGGQSV